MCMITEALMTSRAWSYWHWWRNTTCYWVIIKTVVYRVLIKYLPRTYAAEVLFEVWRLMKFWLSSKYFSFDFRPAAFNRNSVPIPTNNHCPFVSTVSDWVENKAHFRMRRWGSWVCLLYGFHLCTNVWRFENKTHSSTCSIINHPGKIYSVSF